MSRPRRSQTLEQRFWQKVQKGLGCWNWGASPNGNGYGQFRWLGSMMPAHRLAWMLAVGPIPTGLILCHTCDNRKCVRPEHLFVGTHADNAHDRDSKGRGRPGDFQAAQRRSHEVTQARLRAAVETLVGSVRRSRHPDATAAEMGEPWKRAADVANQAFMLADVLRRTEPSAAMTPVTPGRVLVCGGRDYADHRRVTTVLDELVALRPNDRLTIIEGCAPGADSLAEAWATTRRQENVHFPADWARHGKAAGPIRNRQMLVEGKPGLVIAFPGGRGTANMVEQARAAGVPVREVPR